MNSQKMANHLGLVDFVDEAEAAVVDIPLGGAFAAHVFDATPIGSQLYAETTLN